jgi:single-strand DNA-binding protein
MASDFNQSTFTGRLARDVEVKNTQGGMTIASFSVAVGSQWFDKTTQQKKEDVAFIDVTAFGKLAEIIGQYAKKGQQVLVSGRLKQETWNDKTTGQKRSKLVVVAENFKMFGGKNDGLPASEPQEQSHVPAGSPDGGDEDVPF